MANETADKGPSFRKGQPLRADDLRKLQDGTLKRLVGSGASTVRRGPNGSLAVDTRVKGRRPGPQKLVAEITGGGEEGYTWTKHSGPGPDGGSAREVNDTGGVSAGTRVVLFKIKGEWWFSVASGGGGSTLPAKITSQVSTGIYQVSLYENGYGETATATAITANVVDSASYDFQTNDRVTVFLVGETYWIASQRAQELSNFPLVSICRIVSDEGAGEYKVRRVTYPGGSDIDVFDPLDARELNGSVGIAEGMHFFLYNAADSGGPWFQMPVGEFTL